MELKRVELKRVVVTGMGALTPLGNSVDDYWSGLINGVSGADMITLFDAAKFRTKFACEVKNFDPVQFLDKKEARKIDRFTQLALVASDQAMTDAGLNKENINPNKRAAFLKYYQVLLVFISVFRNISKLQSRE